MSKHSQSADPTHDDGARREATLRAAGVRAPFVRSPYNYDTMAASDESGILCRDPSLTSQAFREESDINYIVENFTRTGNLPGSMVEPQFPDFSDAPRDYHAALNLINQANTSFMTLPANVRSRFANDPARLLDFIGRPENIAEARRLGILKPEDLSPAGEAAPASEAQPAGGKSGQHSQASKKAVSGSTKGGEGE